jgi:hypothetical protein
MRFVSMLTRDQLAGTPAWRWGSGSPPISPRAAEEIALNMVHKLTGDHEWTQPDISLKAFDVHGRDDQQKIRWIYVLNFRLLGRTDFEGGSVNIIVLMDGTAIEPKRVDWPHLDAPPAWGENVEGFQMAATLDASNSVLHCWIRNAGATAIVYNDFEFGYCENIALEIHQGATWTPIYSEIFPGGNGARGAVPTDTKIRWMEPSQIMTNTWEWRDTLSREAGYEEMMKMSHGDTNLDTWEEWDDARQTSLMTLCKGDTFALDLIHTSWPTNALAAESLEVRVKQNFHLASPDERYPYVHGDELTLYSPVVTLDRSTIKQFQK